MNSSTIRSDLKHNFLKNIIFRLDYNGLIDAEVENFILEIRADISKRGYINLKEEFINELEVEPNPFMNNNSFLSRELQKVYVFSSESGKSLKISKSYIIIDIDTEENESMFSAYVPLITLLVKKLKAIEYVKFERIAIKKVNVCVLLDKNTVSDYFTNTVLSLFSDDSATVQAADEIKYGDYEVNYNRRMQEGYMVVQKSETEESKMEEVHQVVLDIESCVQNSQILNELLAKEEAETVIKKLNELIFETYIDSLTEGFKEKLTQKEFNESDIIGVISNVKKD